MTVWCPYFRKDIDVLERVQRRATKMSTQLKRLTYQDRLIRLGLTTLEIRRARGDLIQFYKIINGLEVVKWTRELRCIEDQSTSNTSARVLRRHNKHFYREKPGLSSARDNFFINRVIPLWNELPASVKDAQTLNTFKAGLDSLEMFSI